MKKQQVLSIVAVLVLALGCGGAPTETAAPPETAVENVPAPEPVVEARNDQVFVCSCGEDCDCNTVAVGEGTCACGTELTAAHVVKVKGDDALLCTCASGCTCEINAEDENKCSCGADLRTVSLVGTGLYFCRCGGECTCNFVSAEPGTCTCGMELITSS